MAKLSIDNILPKIKKLPPLNIVVRKLMEVVRNEYSSAEDVTKVLSSDQAIASKVLELVNSSFYGFPGRISTISRAVVILGNKSIQNLALAFASLDAFKDSKLPIPMEEFWKHSLFTATAGQVVATKSKYPVPEEAFIAGLLHDIGQLVLAEFVTDDYSTIIANTSQTLILKERRVLGITHAQVGALLMQHWNLPPKLCESVKEHHARQAAYDDPEKRLCSILKMAEIIAVIVGNESFEGFEPADTDKLIRGVGIPPSEYLQLFIEAEKLALSMEEFLNIPLQLALKSNVNIDNEILTIILCGNDALRISWLESVIKYYGYHPICLPLSSCASQLLQESHSLALVDFNRENDDISELESIIKALKKSQTEIVAINDDDTKQETPLDAMPQLPIFFRQLQIDNLIPN